MVTNAQGKVLSWLNRPEKTNANLAETRSTIREALKGVEPPLNVLWPDLWSEGDILYQVVTVPVFTGRGVTSTLLGTITLGTELTAADAKELKQNTPLDVTFFLDRKPFASSGDQSTDYMYNSFINDNEALIDSVLNYRVISDPVTYNSDGSELFSFVSPLGKGESAFYIASVPAAEELAILSKMQNNILLISAIAILVIIPLAIFLGRLFLEPINRLTDAMTRVETGDFNISVAPSSDDEIGRMTKSFNTMVGGLRERFALQKYVGTHTLDMIKSSTNENAELGGQKTELAILFSDIRNSTQTIEKNDPNKFVRELNKLLSFQSEIVEKYNGSIDKYVGDSMIALFNGKEALNMAVNCAIDIQKKFLEDSKNGASFFKGLGIGVNYGSVVLGNMGGKKRMDYTVIGPEVNLCARLCDAAKSGQILMPEYLIKNAKLNGAVKLGTSDVKKLKGFSKNLKVVEIHYG